MPTTIALDDFLKVDIRVGTIVEAAANDGARKPAYRLVVDFGPELGRKKSSAQLVPNYRAEELLGRQVAAVVNFPPRQVAKTISQVLVLGFPDADGNVVLVGVERPVPDGGRLY
jgi:tRNA-binding protein